jgi:hypothetical protein
MVHNVLPSRARGSRQKMDLSAEERIGKEKKVQVRKEYIGNT